MSICIAHYAKALVTSNISLVDSTMPLSRSC